MNNELINFFKPANFMGYKNPINSFFYPMSGGDLTVLNNQYIDDFIYCEVNYDHWLNFNFIDNYLGLNKFEIEKIEILSDENYNWLLKEYKKNSKLPIFQYYLNEMTDNFSIKKYYFKNTHDNITKTLIIIQAEAFSIAKILQDLGLNLNLVIKTPGNNFNGEEGASLFFKKYQEATNFKPLFVLGYEFSELANYQRKEIDEMFSIFSINEELMHDLLVKKRGEGIARRCGF